MVPSVGYEIFTKPLSNLNVHARMQCTNKQTDRQTNKQTNRQTNRQTNKQMNERTN